MLRRQSVYTERCFLPKPELQKPPYDGIRVPFALVPLVIRPKSENHAATYRRFADIPGFFRNARLLCRPSSSSPHRAVFPLRNPDCRDEKWILRKDRSMWKVRCVDAAEHPDSDVQPVLP